MKKTFYLLPLLLILFFLGLGWLGSVSKINFGGKIEFEKKEILVGGQKLIVQIADEPKGRSRGLAGRESLGKNEGMLFIFERPDFYRFWMKEMKIPLDFIWILDDKIVGITESVPPPDELSENLPIYQPLVKVDKVLEVNAGWAASHGIKIGDAVKF